MGALNSIHTQMQPIEAEDEDTRASEGTPRPANKHHKRLLSIDPRSPSESIMRTPIVVDKTPSLSQQSYTPLDSTPSLVDPRSPSTDFSRTPLCFGNARQLAAAQDETLSVQSILGTPVSHQSMNSESGIESAEVTPVLRIATKENKHPSSPDSAVNSEDAYPTYNDLNAPGCSEPISCADSSPGSSSSDADDTAAPLLTNNLQSMRLSQENAKSPLVQLTPNIPEGHLKPRHIALSKKIDSMTMNSKALRSPLSLVDNSPRYGRLGKPSNRPPQSDRSGQHAEKENICH